MGDLKDPPPRPFLKWVGGKRQLLPELMQAVAAAGAFARYHEPFLGGGALFFALAKSRQLATGAALADVNQNLIDAYLGVRDEVDGVIQVLLEHRRLHCEQHYYEVRALQPLTLAARAARVIYLNRTGFNGLYRENRKGQFNVPFGRYKNPRICDEENLRAGAALLANVELSSEGFVASLARARTGDLVYLDPPYVPVSATAVFTDYSKGGFGDTEQRQLATMFAQLVARGVKVILTNSLTDATRELYQGSYFHQVYANRTVNSRSDRRGKIGEALITSFPLIPGRNDARRTRTGPTRGLDRVLARQWLLAHGYDDIARLIDEVTAEWTAQGKRTRRNWWDVLAGGVDGEPSIVAGREFPVLRAAQLRQGRNITTNALSRSTSEQPPALSRSDRRAER